MWSPGSSQVTHEQRPRIPHSSSEQGSHGLAIEEADRLPLSTFQCPVRAVSKGSAGCRTPEWTEQSVLGVLWILLLLTRGLAVVAPGGS